MVLKQGEEYLTPVTTVQNQILGHNLRLLIPDLVKAKPDIVKGK